MPAKIYHVERDYSKSLEEQKKELKNQYINFNYLWTDKAIGNAEIHFIASGKKENRE